MTKRNYEGELIKAAMELTQCDIKKFNTYLTLLNSDSIPFDLKKNIALHVKKINDSVMTLKGRVSERDFNIFYHQYFNNQSRVDATYSFGVSVRTISNAKVKVLKELSAVLYPDLFIYQLS